MPKFTITHAAPANRNPIAKALASRLYAPRIVKSKRIYNRKRLSKESA